MFLSISFAVHFLAFLPGAASYSLFSHREIMVAKREQNSTTAISEFGSSSTIIPPCTTTVTSILGEQFAQKQKGSCSHTYTITSTIQPTESTTQSIVPKTSSSLVTSPSISTSASATCGKDSITTTALDHSSSSTSRIKPGGTPKQDSPPPNPLTSSAPVDCITTVTSISGQFLVLGTGGCSRTITIISTIKESLIPEPASTRSRPVHTTTSSEEINTLEFPQPTNPSLSTPIKVTTSTVFTSSSATTPPEPEHCTTTTTSILGKPFAPLPGPCSKTVTVVVPAEENTGSQPTSTSTSQPSFPVNTDIGPPSPTTTHSPQSTTSNLVQLPQETKSNSLDPIPAITKPGTTFSLPVPTNQLSQPEPETSTSQAPVAQLPVSTTQAPNLPNSPATTSTRIPAETTTPLLSSPSDVSTTQKSQPVPDTTTDLLPLPCATGCVGSRPTTEPASVPSANPTIPAETSVATKPQSLPSDIEQKPTSTTGSIITITEGISSHLATPPLPVSAVSSTPNLGLIVIGSQTVSQDTASNFIFGSQTLVPGSAITVNGHQVSAAASGGAIILNPAPPKPTDSLSAETSTGPAPAMVVVDGTTVTGDTASGFVIGTQTLFLGSAITAGGQVITLPLPSATQAPTPTQTQSPDTVPVILIGSSTFTQNSASAFIIGSQTLSPGSAVTISGQVISLSPTGNAVVVNGATATRISTTFSTEIQAPVTSLVVAGQTLTAGGRVTVGGDVLSLAGGVITVIGTVTVEAGGAAATATPTGKKNLAGRLESKSKLMVALQVSCVFGLGSLGLF